MTRIKSPENPIPAKIIAYDFETTRIAAGTPRPLYLTAYAAYKQAKYPRLHFAEEIRSIPHLQKILLNHFLTDEFLGCKFVAWYGNGFDAYFIAAALITVEDIVMRPYLTRGGALRGLRIVRREDIDKKNTKAWEFLDGMAMLGMQGIKLDKFLEKFAPRYRKLTDAINFETGEEFNPRNKRHCEYAMRDSVGLWHAMVRAQDIILDRFREPLRVTMGGSCIRIFQANIPEGVRIPTPRDEVLRIVHEYVMRGGFCYIVRRYRGPVWKYDLNQAYAAAMRDAQLPAGFTTRMNSLPSDGAYIARITATNPMNRIPLYHRVLDSAGRIKSVFSFDTIPDTWLTSIEIEQLQREGWQIHCSDAWSFDITFSMRDYVDKLEQGRMSCEGGPSGPEGTMYKAVGNHSYGKLAEMIEPLETLMAFRQPGPDWFPYYEAVSEADPLPFTWGRWVDDDLEKAYHQPHVAAFITAHVRMVVRRAALIDPDAWLYADTDCTMFTRDVTSSLDIHPTRYGAWKIEESGTEHQLIAKKVYRSIEPGTPFGLSKRHAKGLHVRHLSEQDFDQWYDGEPPVQHQIQRQNFLRAMHGEEMFREQIRRGTATEKNLRA